MTVLHQQLHRSHLQAAHLGIPSAWRSGLQTVRRACTSPPPNRRQHSRGSQVSAPHSQQTDAQHQAQEQQQQHSQEENSNPHSSSHSEPAAAADAAVGASSADAATQQLLPLPTRRQLREAGRFDLLYALHVHSRTAKTHAAKTQQHRQQMGGRPTQAQPTSGAAVEAAEALAALGGLAAPASRRGTNRNALRWEDVEEAVRVGARQGA